MSVSYQQFTENRNYVLLTHYLIVRDEYVNGLTNVNSPTITDLGEFNFSTQQSELDEDQVLFIRDSVTDKTEILITRFITTSHVKTLIFNFRQRWIIHFDASILTLHQDTSAVKISSLLLAVLNRTGVYKFANLLTSRQAGNPFCEIFYRVAKRIVSENQNASFPEILGLLGKIDKYTEVCPFLYGIYQAIVNKHPYDQYYRFMGRHGLGSLPRESLNTEGLFSHWFNDLNKLMPQFISNWSCSKGYGIMSTVTYLTQGTVKMLCSVVSNYLIQVDPVPRDSASQDRTTSSVDAPVDAPVDDIFVCILDHSRGATQNYILEKKTTVPLLIPDTRPFDPEFESLNDIPRTFYKLVLIEMPCSVARIDASELKQELDKFECVDVVLEPQLDGGGGGGHRRTSSKILYMIS